MLKSLTAKSISLKFCCSTLLLRMSQTSTFAEKDSVYRLLVQNNVKGEVQVKLVWLGFS